MKKIFAIIGVVFAIACFSSCQEEMEPFQEATGVSLDKTNLSIFPGDYVALKATVNPDNATSKYLEWSSSDTKIASVDSWGRVAGVAPGTAKITVKTASGGYTASCNVTVDPIVETAVSVDPATLSVLYEESATITATVEPSNASYKTVTWTSADEDIATVDDKGKVKGVGLGTTVITATSHFGLTAKCTVTVSADMPTVVETVDVWKSDKAGFRPIFGAAADENKSAGTDGWLKFANGAATWTANTTGKIRTATLSLSTGSSITVTQLDPADFKGTFSFRTQRFSNNKTVATAAADVTFNVTITDPLVGETLTDFDGKTYTNNLGLQGLYLDAVADAVLDIDYDNKTARFGLFLDERKAQPVANGNDTYPFVCFIPECGTTWNSTTMASPWNFVPIPISATQNYQWLWFTVSSDFSVLNYNYGNKQNLIGKDGSAGTTIIGITCAIAKNATPAAADIFTTYNVIYQANPNKKMDTGGFTLTRL